MTLASALYRRSLENPEAQTPHGMCVTASGTGRESHNGAFRAWAGLALPLRQANQDRMSSDPDSKVQGRLAACRPGTQHSAVLIQAKSCIWLTPLIDAELATRPTARIKPRSP